MDREKINPSDVRKTPYNHAIKVGNTIYVAGQVGKRIDSSVDVGDVAAQTAVAFDNLTRVLAAAGATLDDIVQMRTYLTDPTHVPIFQQARRPFLKEIPPSTLLVVQALAEPEMLVELEVVAVARS